MSLPDVSRRACLVAALLIFCTIYVSARPIRLHTPVFPEKPSAKAAAKSSAANASATKTSGLYLIQFHGALKPEWRQTLATNGVDLLRFVPDDAFVARLQNVSTADIQALPFVEWVGPFEPKYKIHKSLQPKLGKGVVPASLTVTVLVAPRTAPGNVASARGMFANVREQTAHRFGTVLRGQVNSSQLNALAASDAVLWIEPAPAMKLNDEVSSQIVAGDGGNHALYTQSLGYDGRGVAVAVADSGLNNGDAATMHPDLWGRATNFFFYGTLTDAADEHSHGTHVAGIIAGDGATGEMDENGFLYGLGVAPAARIVTQRIFDGVGNYEAPPSYETLTRHATRAGAEIGSNSWGDDTQGRYDTSAMEFDALVRDADALAAGDQPYILEFSAGNAGPGSQTIGSPAVAKNVIATGASQNNRLDLFIYSDGPEAMADFSSRGPCEDGRIKPDITAPGTWIASLKSESATDENAWAPIDNYYLYMGGTSQAGPHASGAATVFVQYYRQAVTNHTPSPALVKAALINSAVDMDDVSGTTSVPN
ncbi:MAG TPA: S8 family serine peptidase, partial [Candidatus Paceibacterota bacterium]|nr:S8 family serine peptidase [Candidatus Paceibacterota bacterium]